MEPFSVRTLHAYRTGKYLAFSSFKLEAVRGCKLVPGQISGLNSEVMYSEILKLEGLHETVHHQDSASDKGINIISCKNVRFNEKIYALSKL